MEINLPQHVLGRRSGLRTCLRDVGITSLSVVFYSGAQPPLSSGEASEPTDAGGGGRPTRIADAMARGVSTAAGPSNRSVRSVYPAGVQRRRPPPWTTLFIDDIDAERPRARSASPSTAPTTKST
jgi:hypothetical protein